MNSSALSLLSEINKKYYMYFSKYKNPLPEGKKVAWIASFVPVEILEAFGISYFYPESYSAVIAASGKERECLEAADKSRLSRDCCSYSLCFSGALLTQKAPRGLPPKPDILIASRNQCNTLPNWWSMMAAELKVPLIILDYPGDKVERRVAFKYVSDQHSQLIAALEGLCSEKLDKDGLEKLVNISRQNCALWNKTRSLMAEREINPTLLFDYISMLVIARCIPETTKFLEPLYDELRGAPETLEGVRKVFWLGYPLWYHKRRFLSEYLENCRIVGSNYLSWWELDYSGESVEELLFNAYNYTFLNLGLERKTELLKKEIEKSGAEIAVVIQNKSCKCDFTTHMKIEIPHAVIEADMIDRSFMDERAARDRIDLLLEI